MQTVGKGPALGHVICAQAPRFHCYHCEYDAEPYQELFFSGQETLFQHHLKYFNLMLQLSRPSQGYLLRRCRYLIRKQR